MLSTHIVGDFHSVFLNFVMSLIVLDILSSLFTPFYAVIDSSVFEVGLIVEHFIGIISYLILVINLIWLYCTLLKAYCKSK